MKKLLFIFAIIACITIFFACNKTSTDLTLKLREIPTKDIKTNCDLQRTIIKGFDAFNELALEKIESNSEELIISFTDISQIDCENMTFTFSTFYKYRDAFIGTNIQLISNLNDNKANVEVVFKDFTFSDKRKNIKYEDLNEEDKKLVEKYGNEVLHIIAKILKV